MEGEPGWAGTDGQGSFWGTGKKKKENFFFAVVVLFLTAVAAQSVRLELCT